jgi:hypothetical protein
MKRKSVPKRNPVSMILLAVILLCIAGFTGYYFGILKRAYLTAIEISHPLPMEFSQSRQLTAFGKYSDDSTRDVTNRIIWHSSDMDVASISNAGGTSGLIVSGNAGKTTITATDPDTGIVGKTVVTVLAARLVSIALRPSELTITLGQKQQIKATGIYANGKQKDISSSVSWSSSAASIAFLEDTLGSPGLVTSAATGSTVITATDPGTGIIGTTSLTVSEAKLISFTLSPDDSQISLGSNFSLSATGSFSDGTSREITAELLWASLNRNVVDVNDTDAGKGLIYTKSAGSATITATDPETGLTGSAAIKVTKANILSLEILQMNPSIPLGENIQFTARCKFTDGSSHVLMDSLDWYSSNSSVAQFSSDTNKKGLAFSKNAGTVKITAKDSQTGKTATTSLNVTPAKLVSYLISPRFPSLAVGKKERLSVTGIYTDQSQKDLTKSSEWSVADQSVAKIANTYEEKGIVTSLSIGSTDISARDPESGKSVTTTLMVTSAELVSLDITPALSSMSLENQKQLFAKGTLSDGSTRDMTADVTWTSSNLSVAMVENTEGQKGNVISKTSGVSIITAKDPVTGIQGTSKISVTGTELMSIHIEPNTQTIPLGLNIQLNAQGLYSDKSIRDITHSATWFSENPSIISISNNPGNKGEIKAKSLGTSIISVKDSATGIIKALPLTVTKASLKAIQISPEQSEIYLGKLQQLKAIGEYTDGSTKDITESLDWQSSEPTLISVRNTPGRKGLATSLAVGSAIIEAMDPETKISGKTSVTGRVDW